jgi:hypothetical protein
VADGGLQGVEHATSRNLQSFLFSTFPQPVGHRALPLAGTKKTIWRLGTRRLLCARSFAEPVSLPSTAPGDFRLPATALRIGFALLALRARRRGDTRAGRRSLQDPDCTISRSLHSFLFSTFPQQWVQPVDNSALGAGKAGVGRHLDRPQLDITPVLVHSASSRGAGFGIDSRRPSGDRPEYVLCRRYLERDQLTG